MCITHAAQVIECDKVVVQPKRRHFMFAIHSRLTASSTLTMGFCGAVENFFELKIDGSKVTI